MHIRSEKDLTAIFQKHFSSESCVKTSKTWDINKLTQHELDMHSLHAFYKNRAGYGLLEAPTKFLNLHYKGRFRNARNWRPLLREATEKFTGFLKKGAYHEYLMLAEVGIFFPDFLPLDREFFFQFDGKKFNSNIRKYALSFQFIREHADWNAIKHICEIGGGYGGMIELIDANTTVERFYIIALFQTLCVSMTYLSKRLMPKGFEIVFLENGNELRNIPKKACVFIPISTYQQIKTSMHEVAPIDLFINSNSFVEMDFEVIEDYFRFMETYKNCLFYSFNALDRREGGHVNSLKRFPYDNRWKLLGKRMSEVYLSGTLHSIAERGTKCDRTIVWKETITNVKNVMTFWFLHHLA